MVTSNHYSSYKEDSYKSSSGEMHPYRQSIFTYTLNGVRHIVFCVVISNRTYQNFSYTIYGDVISPTRTGSFTQGITEDIIINPNTDTYSVYFNLFERKEDNTENKFSELTLSGNLNDYRFPDLSLNASANINESTCTINWNSSHILSHIKAEIDGVTIYSNTNVNNNSGTITLDNLKFANTYNIILTGTLKDTAPSITVSKTIRVTTQSLPTPYFYSFNIGSDSNIEKEDIEIRLSESFPRDVNIDLVLTNPKTNASTRLQETVPANTTYHRFSFSSSTNLSFLDAVYRISTDTSYMNALVSVSYSSTDFLGNSYTISKDANRIGIVNIISQPTFTNFSYGNSDNNIKTIFGGDATIFPNTRGNLNIVITQQAQPKDYANISHYVYRLYRNNTGSILRTGTFNYPQVPTTTSFDIGSIDVPSLTETETISIIIYAVDSRGLQSPHVTKQVTVIPYSVPSIRFDVFERFGNYEPSIVWDFKSYFSTLPINGVNKNSLTIKYRYCEIGSSYGAYIQINDLVFNQTDNQYMRQTTSKKITAESSILSLDIDKDYQVEFTSADHITETKTVMTISAGISIFGIHDDKHVTVGRQADFDSEALLQVGSDIMCKDGNADVLIMEKVNEAKDQATESGKKASSTNTSNKLYLIGAQSQGNSQPTYSHDTAYVGTDGHLYSNNKKVVNLNDSQSLTNKTYNGYTLNVACEKGVTDSSYASSISSSGTYLTTERDVYYGLPYINNSHTYNSNTNIYAPTTAGTSGYFLKSNGSGSPSWTSLSASSIPLNDGSGNSVFDVIGYLNSKLQRGRSSSVLVSANSTSSITVSFDIEFYGGATPNVTATAFTSSGKTAEVSIANITSTKFTAYIKNTDSSSQYFRVEYIATTL